MESLWNDTEAAAHLGNDLQLRVYTSRLLGANPELVLHGGGNTSVKSTITNFYGESEDILYVKGSGWDLGTIEAPGFSPVRLAATVKMAALDSLSDPDMVRELRAAMILPDAPTPSIEAILHGILPWKYVDHTHANAIVALTNLPDGERAVREVFGENVLILPWIMPGFDLAKAVHQAVSALSEEARQALEGIILMQHGIFTFSDDARTSYENMIELVTKAEKFLQAKSASTPASPLRPAPEGEDLLALARLRREVSKARGQAQIAISLRSEEAITYSLREDVDQIATRGPLTPDHVIRTKAIPALVSDQVESEIAEFVSQYQAYVARNLKAGQTALDPAPRIVIRKGHGLVAFGDTPAAAQIVADLAEHTHKTIALAEAAGGWSSLPEAEMFRMEYWDLEQAKLKKGGSRPTLQGKVALVTGSAAGIGFACAESLAKQGATVIGFDLNPDIVQEMAKIRAKGVVVNLTDEEAVKNAVDDIIRAYGGLDILVSNAGIFTAGQYLEDLEQSNWGKSMAVNLTSHQQLLKFTIPYLKLGLESSIVLVGSRNVAAPGAGAASYSCAKAALTQLCRVAALELAPHGVRCNIIHPDAVFDTKLWTPEALKRSAERYGITVEEYKTRNLMKTEIRSRDVGEMVAAMSGPLFGRTTGAQIPVDGGNDRVI